jgi:lipopolysaccharide export system permease protein
VFQGRKYYTIQDAWEAFRLLASQGLNTQRVRTLFYHMVVTPFFALLLVSIVFVSLPPYGRGMNLLLTSFVLTGTTLFIWGVLYLLFRVSQTGVVPPEYGMVLIVSLLGVVAFHHYAVRTNR